MSEVLLILLANSLLIVGLHVATYYGNILGFIRDPADATLDEQYEMGFSKNGKGKKKRLPHWNKLPDWVKKPLYDCPTCMASFHSTYFYWYFMPFEWGSLLWYPFYIVALSAANTYIYRQIE